MNDLATWLLEQIAEDEEIAQAAASGDWEDVFRIDIGAQVDATHIARWNPARVLAEGKAKRRIVDLAGLYTDAAYPNYEGGFATALEEVLQHLAQPYADRPGYRQEWTP